MMNFTKIIQAWKTVADFAVALGVKYPTAMAWKNRGTIPAKHWPRLIEAAKSVNLSLTLEQLHELAEQKQKEGAQ